VTQQVSVPPARSGLGTTGVSQTLRRDSWSRQVRLAARPSAAAWGRRIVRHVLRERHLEAVSGTTLQLVTDLIASAVPASAPGLRRDQLGRQMIVLTVKFTGTSLRLEVWDANPALPALREADVSGDCGRGLLRIDFLSDRWGYHAAGGGKAVWCEVTCPGAGSG
jgi:hypothetical protein